MSRLLSNPETLLLLCCIGGLVVGLNLTLVGLLRGDARVRLEASRWTSAFTGGRDVRRRQDSDLAELHRRVSELGNDKRGDAPQDPPTDG